MINWSILKTWQFWFTAQPHRPTDLTLEILLAVFIACLALAIILALLNRFRVKDFVTVKLLHKIQSLFTALGVFGLFIVFFFWQAIPYLASRFWILVWLLTALIWIYFILKFAFFQAPKKRAELSERQKFLQYLPKKKK